MVPVADWPISQNTPLRRNTGPISSSFPLGCKISKALPRSFPGPLLSDAEVSRLACRSAHLIQRCLLDQLTSDNSTFPYDAQQCANFLDLIRESRMYCFSHECCQSPSSPDVCTGQEGQEFTWLIARVWTFVGEPPALGAWPHTTEIDCRCAQLGIGLTPTTANSALASTATSGVSGRAPFDARS